MPNLPSGTVTFVFSDIEGSTRMLQQLGDDDYARVLARHRQLAGEVFAEHGGQEIDTQGDAFFYSFERARAAVAAAVAVQRAHAVEPWPEGTAVRVRLGLHTGEPAVGDEGYTGLDVVRASRIAASSRGGQVLLSEATRAIAANTLPEGVELRSLGDRALRDIERPEPVYELVIDGLPLPAQPRLPADTPPPAAAPTHALPDWAADAARPFLPGNLPGLDSERLEERVLGQIEQAFRAKEEGRRRRRESRAERSPKPPDRPGREAPALPVGDAARRASVADEIAKLRELRDAGALSDEQYERAVGRVLDG